MRNLDHDSCQMLGQLISLKKIQIIISRSVDGYYISNVFETMDADKSGYLDENEFLNASKNVNRGLATWLDLKQQKR